MSDCKLYRSYILYFPIKNCFFKIISTTGLKDESQFGFNMSISRQISRHNKLLLILKN